MDNTPALNTDGTLKDASKIMWLNSPSDEKVSLPPITSQPILPPNATNSCTNVQQETKPSFNQFIFYPIPTAPASATSGVSNPQVQSKQSGTKSIQKWKSSSNTKVPKTTAISRHLKSTNEQLQIIGPSKEPVDDVENASDSDSKGGPQKKRRQKGDATKDIIGSVFTQLEETDEKGRDQYQCQICHVYTVYCIENKIEMHLRALPDKEHERLEQLEEGNKNDSKKSTQASILTYVVPQTNEQRLTWSQTDLMDKIVRFVVETDQAISIVDHPSFQDLLTYQRPKTKDLEIPHRTVMSEEVRFRAEKIDRLLQQELENLPGRVSLTFDG
ncbi:hypothetical protein C8Q75DRAFT_731801 [Abortiporus biennis]|nr:hypothetical protein C8Q75DRAFT_731801 [Abortiporus biennis]